MLFEISKLGRNLGVGEGMNKKWQQASLSFNFKILIGFFTGNGDKSRKIGNRRRLVWSWQLVLPLGRINRFHDQLLGDFKELLERNSFQYQFVS